MKTNPGDELGDDPVPFVPTLAGWLAASGPEAGVDSPDRHEPVPYALTEAAYDALRRDDGR